MSAPTAGSLDGSFETIKRRHNKLINESRAASVDVCVAARLARG